MDQAILEDRVLTHMEAPDQNPWRDLKAIEASYRTDILTLTVSCAYVEQLLACQKVVRYLERNHGGLLGALQSVASETGHRPKQANHE
jgi:hypothetical protein